MGDQDFEQAFVVVIGGEVDCLEVVVGCGVDGKAGFEHVRDSGMVLHPGGFGEEAVVLLSERLGSGRFSRFVPELVEPVIERRGFGGGFAEVGTAEANGLAAGGVVVDVDDVGAGAVAEKQIEHGGGAAAANGVVETHFTVAGAGAEIGVGTGFEHELDAFEVFVVELVEEAVAEPRGFETRGVENGFENGVVRVFAGVVEDLVVIGIGTGVEEQIGHAAERVGTGDRGLGGELDEAGGGEGGVVGEQQVQGADVGGLDGDIDHANPRSWTSSSSERLKWCLAPFLRVAMRVRRSTVVPVPVL